MNVLITVKTATGDSKVTYTINSENNITAFAKTKEAKSAPDLERSAGRCPGEKIHEPENGCGPSVGGHSELGAEGWRTAAPCGTEESQSAATGQPAGEDAPSPRGQQESRCSGAAAP